MKQYLIYFLLLLFPAIGFGQSSSKVQKFYYKYSTNKDAKSVSIECDLSKTSAQQKEQPLKNMIFARLLIVDSETVEKQDIQSLLANAHADQYEPLVEVRSDGEEVHLLVKEGAANRLDFLALAHDADQFIYANLAGKFNYQELLKLDLDNVNSADELIEKLKKMEQCTEID